MITNSDFNFKENETATLELPFSEHIEELRQRIFHIFWIILLLTFVAFVEVKFLPEYPKSSNLFFEAELYESLAHIGARSADCAHRN